jgi:threonyl-tRNA synthetase
MIHRAILGPFERFFGLLIEHYAGLFPLWLAPIQVRVIPISEKFVSYAKKIKEALEKEGIRVDIDERDLKVGKKIREAEIEKIPYMVIVGQKEEETNTISVRSKKKGILGNLSLEEFVNMLKKEIESKQK